jgi:hypothetical protein
MAAQARGAAMKGGGDKNKKVAAGGRLLSVVAVGCFLLFVVVVFTLSSRRYATLVLDARDRECASSLPSRSAFDLSDPLSCMHACIRLSIMNHPSVN